MHPGRTDTLLGDRSKVIFLVGYYGFGNAGDEAILSATLDHFRGRRADLHFLVAAGNPEQTAAAHGVVGVSWKDTVAIHRAVQSADLVVIGGGGLFHDYWGVDPDTFLTDRHWGIAYYAGPALLASLYRKPLMLFGVGVGPLYSEYGRKLTRLAASAARVITVRDEASKQLLEELGIARNAIRVTADPGFLSSPALSSTLQEAVPEGFALQRPILGVAPRHWGIGVHPDFLELELASALDLFLKQTGGSVVLVPFQYIPGERENDHASAERILNHMRLRERAALAGQGSPEQIQSWLRDCDLVAGMRLHALIFAALGGVPAVPLVYDPKVRELAGRLGLDQLCMDVKDIDAHQLSRRFAEALERRAEIGSAMQATAGEMREKAAENISAAIGLLDFLPAEAGSRLKSIDLFDFVEMQRSRDTLAVELRAAQQEKDSTAERLANVELELAECAQRRAGLEADLRAVVTGVGRFGAILENNLAVYRSQRAWKAMLLLRKGYTLLHRSRLSFLRWAVTLLSGRAGGLEEHELTFPEIQAYIPELRSPIDGGNSPVARSENGGGDAVLSTLPDYPPQRDRCDLVILAIIDFDFRFQRPQQIAAEFARQGHRVFWISPTRFLPAASACAYQVLPLRDNLWEVHLRGRQPDIYMGDLRPEDVDSLSAGLDDLYRGWGIAEHALIVQLPFWRRFALRIRDNYGSPVVYDCMDDWETFENMGAFNVKEEKDLVHECDVLVVTGAELQRKFQGQGLNPVLVRNGADYPFFAAAPPNDLLAGVPRPVVGYFGAIADWIDLDLVYEVAVKRPQYSFVLIGQVFGRDVARLQALGNVRLLGNKPYADIPAYLYNFDVCLIPFLLNQVTKATDPVKLYEYLSLGKPVVATAMAELEQCRDLLYIAHTAEEFAQHIDSAVEENDPDLVRRRVDFARANTWATRVGKIGEALGEAFPLVSILIVTYNSATFVRPCLDSLLRNTAYPRYEVVVVDNASTDETVRLLQEYAERDQRLRFYCLPQNAGFAGGNNRAAQESRGEYLVFLNIDTMVTGGWVGRLLRHFHRDHSIGLICPVTNFAGNEVKINVSYSSSGEMERFARALAVAKYRQKAEISVAPLFCAAMPRAVWERVGGMDTRYEVGMFEDDDLSLRVRGLGLGVFAAEDTFVHHFGQGAFSRLSPEAYNRIFEANRKRFEEKWGRPWVAHRTRPGVRPAHDEKRFEPAEFVDASG